ncbi:MAG: hypothetical protein AAFQ08_02530 [Bacteroidota bacterium]
MTRPLLVCKRLEKRGQICGLYLPEAMLLLLLSLMVFLGVLLLRKVWHFHMLWTLTAPALFIITCLIAQAARKHTPPHFLMSYLTFHLLAPRHLNVKDPYYVPAKDRHDPQ